MGRASRSSRLAGPSSPLSVRRDGGATGRRTYEPPDIPCYLVAGNQYFDASPAGFQAYLNTVKATNPELYDSSRQTQISSQRASAQRALS